jgi:putative cell wall-binding protein
MLRQKSLAISVRYGSPPARRTSLRPPPPALVERRNTRDWALTLPIALLLPALLLPLLVVAGEKPALSVRGDRQPGAVIELVGARFGKVETVDFAWDGSPVSWLPPTRTDQRQAFVLTTSLPTSVAPGTHELVAVHVHEAGGQQREWGASIAVKVQATPTAVPTVPTAPTAPRVTPTARPAATPIVAAVGAAPAVAPIVRPTIAPTAPRTAGSVTSVAPSPGVVGYGSATTGGAGGAVYSVANWAQLKAALVAPGPRIVKVTGNADLDGLGENVNVTHGDLTIDGSAWTGSLKRYSIQLRASNIIVTQLRLRPGDQTANPADDDGLTILAPAGGSLSNILIDHCSLLWAPDVTLAILNNSWDITVQYSILGGGLQYSAHPEGTPPGGHSMGPNVTTIGSEPDPGSVYTRRITFYRNYIVDNNARNIRAHGTDAIDYVNNVVYNWGQQLAALNPRGANVVGNMFKPGPNSTATAIQSETNEAYHTLFASSVYWADNLGLGFTPRLALGAGVQRTSLYGGLLHDVSAAPASQALADTVVNAAGPSTVDAVDQALKTNFTTGTGSFFNGAGYPAPNPSWQGTVQAPPPTVSVERWAGADRFATAAAVSAHSFAAGVPVAFIASGMSFPDALAGGPVAAVEGGPVLLVKPDSVPLATAVELARLRPGRIVVLGGPGAVGAAASSQLQALTTGSVTRIGGTDRYQTAALISASRFAPGVSVAYMATGQDFPDALGAVPAAAQAPGPILLVTAGAVPPATSSELRRLRPQRIVVIGGTGVVSETLKVALQQYTAGSVTRVAGQDRYRTAVAVSATTFSSAATVFVASGVSFADALAGGPPAGIAHSPLLLITGTTIPDAVRSELQRLSAHRIVVLGGSGVIADTVLGQLRLLVPAS